MTPPDENDGMIRFNCPGCGQRLCIEPEEVKIKFFCPICRNKIKFSPEFIEEVMAEHAKHSSIVDGVFRIKDKVLNETGTQQVPPPNPPKQNAAYAPLPPPPPPSVTMRSNERKRVIPGSAPLPPQRQTLIIQRPGTYLRTDSQRVAFPTRDVIKTEPDDA